MWTKFAGSRQILKDTAVCLPLASMTREIRPIYYLESYQNHFGRTPQQNLAYIHVRRCYTALIRAFSVFQENGSLTLMQWPYSAN